MEIAIINNGYFLCIGSPADPSRVNFRKLGLFTKRIPPNINDQAEKVEYYLNYENGIYSNLAVEEIFDYQETKTVSTIKWYARKAEYTDLQDENTLYYVDWVGMEKTFETIN